MAVKLLCREAGGECLDAGPKGAIVAFHNNAFANPVGLIAFIQKQAGEVKLRPDHTLVYRRAWETEPARVKGVRQMLDELVKIAEGGGISPSSSSVRSEERRVWKVCVSKFKSLWTPEHKKQNTRKR